MQPLNQVRLVSIVVGLGDCETHFLEIGYSPHDLDYRNRKEGGNKIE